MQRLPPCLQALNAAPLLRFGLLLPTCRLIASTPIRWIAEFDVDAFRIDATVHVTTAYMARFATNIRSFARSLGKEHVRSRRPTCELSLGLLEHLSTLSDSLQYLL